MSARTHIKPLFHPSLSALNTYVESPGLHIASILSQALGEPSICASVYAYTGSSRTDYRTIVTVPLGTFLIFGMTEVRARRTSHLITLAVH